MRARRVNFYEAGSGQERDSGSIGSPFYSSFHEQLDSRFRRGLIQRCDEAHSQPRVFISPLTLVVDARGVNLTQVDARAFRHLNQFPNLLFSHSSLSEIAQAVKSFPLSPTPAWPKTFKLVNSFPPGPHLRDRGAGLSRHSTLAWRGRLQNRSPRESGHAAWPNSAPIIFCPPPRSPSSSVTSCHRGCADTFAAPRDCAAD
jgi:hypothetical protein